MIDDEVVSFSYSYTVVIYVRTGFLCDLHLCIDFPSLSYSQFVLFSVDWAVTLVYSYQQLFNSTMSTRKVGIYVVIILLVGIKDKPAKRY